jgi:hypothetical protein
VQSKVLKRKNILHTKGREKLKNIYYTNKIHTNKDKVANKENIEYIVENIIEFIDEVL